MWTVYCTTVDRLSPAFPNRTPRPPVLIPTLTRDEARCRHLDKLADIYLQEDTFGRAFLDEALAPGKIRCR